jgi:G3E family GTPase
VNRVPERKNGVTLIEANGTSDACSLMGFLGVGINKRFLPPIQISVVDVKNWQRRGVYKELESNQVQVSSLVVLAHLDKATAARKSQVVGDIKRFNPSAEIISMDEIDVQLLPKLTPSTKTANQLDHQKAHWASSSVDMVQLPDLDAIRSICKQLPKTIMRVKGCTQIGSEEHFTYFERTPDGEVFIRPYNGIPITGPKLVTIGPGSQPSLLEEAILLSMEPKKCPTQQS